MENRFNLIDEAWIPVVAKGNRSLKEIFSDSELLSLGGTPVQKIAVLNLLIAIAQAAATPQDTQEWAAMGPDGLSKRCIGYLERWRDAFWLYGDKPFLQMPACSKAKLKPYGTVMPQVASGNSTLLTHLQLEPIMSDASRALLLVEQMGFGLGGKKTDNSVVLSKGYTKGKSAQPGPFLSAFGLLHSFLLGDSVLETIWLNMLTRNDVADIHEWENGIGTAPWEKMPEGEDCPTARTLKSSLMGSLVPLSRFCLLKENGLHYTEGIVYPNFKEGMIPSLTYSIDRKKVLWTDPLRSPSHHLPQLLSFWSDKKFSCLYLEKGLERLLEREYSFFIWHGGLSCQIKTGSNFLSGMDDYVESQTAFISARALKESLPILEERINALRKIGQTTYTSIDIYYNELSSSEAKQHAKKASDEFYEMADKELNHIIQYCQIQDSSLRNKKLSSLFREIVGYAQKVYDQNCPHIAARQLEIWARRRPFMNVPR